MNKSAKIGVGIFAGLAVLMLVMYWYVNRKPTVEINLISPEEQIMGIEINGKKTILKFNQDIKVNRFYSIERTFGSEEDPTGSTTGVAIKDAKGNIVETILLDASVTEAKIDGVFE